MATPGIKCKLYLDMSVAGDGSDLQELKSIGDWTQNFEFDVTRFTIRGVGYETGVKTGAKLGWSGKLLHSPGNAVYEKAQSLINSRDAACIVLALTGPKGTAGSVGYQCLCQFTKSTQDQGPQAVVMDDTEIVPYPPDDDDAATWLRRAVVGSGGTITYTPIIPDTVPSGS